MITDATAAALAAYITAVAEMLAGMTFAEATRARLDGKISAAAYEGYQHVYGVHNARPEWYAQPVGAAAEFASALFRKVGPPAYQSSDWA